MITIYHKSLILQRFHSNNLISPRLQGAFQNSLLYNLVMNNVGEELAPTLGSIT